MSLAAATEENEYLVVVGMNRPRLNKIISLVDEKRSTHNESISDTSSGENDALSSLGGAKKVPAKLVQCLAAMDSYEDENGNSVRYLSSVVYHDGSPMTEFFDDVSFRESLRSVMLVGYEWQDGDTSKIESYFKANQLEVEVKCVTPNPEFDNLQQEMEAFKNLDNERKEQCLADGSMGPSKMAKLIVEAMNTIENEKIQEARLAAAKADEERLAMAMQEASDSAVEVTAEPPKPQHEPADPKLPRYACRMCRTVLFGENHMAQDHVQNLHSFKYNSRSSGKAMCQSVFCSDDVLEWLSPSGADAEGKLACPKCSNKIGHWNWAGAQCSCGTWVTPAIQVPLSKVDILKPEMDIRQGSVALAGIINPIFTTS